MANEDFSYDGFDVYSSISNNAHRLGEEVKVGASISPTNPCPLPEKQKPYLTKLQAWINSTEDISDKLQRAIINEVKVYSEIHKSLQKWVDAAAETRLLQDCIEYKSISPSQHTSNQWVVEQERGKTTEEISNATYKLSIQTKLRPSPEFPEYWDVSWSLRTNAPVCGRSYIYNKTLAEKDRCFTDGERAAKYITGRIKHYAPLFQELYPPVPKEREYIFFCNGVLLPGYRLEPDGESHEL